MESAAQSGVWRWGQRTWPVPPRPERAGGAAEDTRTRSLREPSLAPPAPPAPPRALCAGQMIMTPITAAVTVRGRGSGTLLTADGQCIQFSI